MTRLALVGVGHIHIDGYVRNLADSGLDPGYVCDPTRLNKAKAIADTLRWKLVPSLAELKQQPGIDGVVVVSETIQHNTILPQVAGLGKPVFVEKPLAVSPEQAIDLGKLFGAHQPFATGQLLHQCTAAKMVKEKIKSGELGQLISIKISYSHNGLRKGWFNEYPWMTDALKAGVGGFGDLGILAVGLAHDLTGENPSRVRANISRLNEFDTSVPDHYGTASMITGQGTQIEIYVGWMEDPNFVGSRNGTRSLFMLEVIGTKGHAFFTTGRRHGVFSQTHTHRKEAIPNEDLGAGGTLTVFIDAVRRNDPCIPAALQSAVDDIIILHQLYVASELRREVRIETGLFDFHLPMKTGGA